MWKALRCAVLWLTLGLALSPAAVVAAPQGLASLKLAGPGLLETASGPNPTAQLVQILDLDADGVEESIYQAEAECRWSFHGGVLNLGSRVAIFGRRLPFATSGHVAHAYATQSERPGTSRDGDRLG